MSLIRYSGVIACALVLALSLHACPPSDPVEASIAVSHASLDFGSSTTSRTLRVNTSGPSSVPWSASADAPWISLLGASGQQDGTITVNVDRDAMLLASNSGTVTVTGAGRTINVPVQAAKATGLTNLQAFSNPGDPLLMKGTTADGGSFQYFGDRDANGNAASVTSMMISTPDTAKSGQPESNETIVELDDMGRISRMVMPDGSILTLQYTGEDHVIASLLSSDGDLQVNVDVDLNGDSASGFSVSASHLFDIIPGEKNTGVRGPITALPLIDMASSALSTPAKGTAAVSVTRCASPADGADVTVNVNPVGEPAYTVPAFSLGDGQYSYTVPTGPSDGTQTTDDICSGIASAVGNLCTGISVTGPARVQICTAIGAAIDFALGGPTGEGAAIFAACISGFNAVDAACKTIGGDLPPGAPSAVDALCEAIMDVVDRFTATDLILTPFATVDGTTSAGPPQMVTSSGPLPDLAVAVSNDVRITSFTTSPADPAPFEAYLATVVVSCVDIGKRIVMDIFGDDGYSDARTCVTTETEATCILYVPGAEVGVMDVVTVVVEDGPTRQIALIF
jgi:hypothetical protein